jgi:hypothetical protein
LHPPPLKASRLALSAVVFGLLMLGLFGYNYARFEHPFRTGADYITGGPQYMTVLKKHDAMLSPVWLRRNFYIYFLRIPTGEDFVARLAHPWPYPFGKDVTHLKPDNEPVYVDAHSVLLMTPLLGFLLLFPFVRMTRSQRVLALALGGVFCLHLAFLLGYAWAMRRFTVDFVPMGLLLGFVAAAAFLERFPEAEARLRDLGLILLAWSVGLHFVILRAGAAKTMGQHLLTEGVRMPPAAWPAGLLAVILGACLLEMRASPRPKDAAA